MPSPVIGSTTPAASPDEQHAPVGETRRVVARRDRPRAHGLGRRASARRGCRATTAGRGARATAALRSLATPAVGAQHAVADVRAAAGQREHPRVPGEEIALEEHPEPVVVDVGEVLAHRVPFAEIAGRVRLERAADRRPVAVGARSRDARAIDSPSPSTELDVGRRAARPSRPRTCSRTSTPRAAREPDERGVEDRAARRPPRASPSPAGSGSVDPPAASARRARSRRTGATPAARSSARVRPSASSCRSAPVVSPSPHVLSRGNAALSTQSVEQPAVAEP